MKNASPKKSSASKKDAKKIDSSSLKKIKGGQSPIHRTTQAKGKGAISWLLQDIHLIKEFVWWIMAHECTNGYSEMIPDKIFITTIIQTQF